MVDVLPVMRDVLLLGFLLFSFCVNCYRLGLGLIFKTNVSVPAPGRSNLYDLDRGKSRTGPL